MHGKEETEGMPNPRNHWTVRHGKEWAVKQEGRTCPLAVFQKQADAWKETVRLARSAKGEAFLQNQSGQIRERNTYNDRDKFPPQG